MDMHYGYGVHHELPVEGGGELEVWLRGFDGMEWIVISDKAGCGGYLKRGGVLFTSNLTCHFLDFVTVQGKPALSAFRSDSTNHNYY